MSSVYAQAFCTISACGSSNSEGGYFHNKNPLFYFPFNLLSSPGSRTGLVIKQGQFDHPADTFSYEVNSSPLSKRSWAFQERLLSRRIVHFGSSLLFFECNTLYASELEREGTEYDELQALNRDGRAYSSQELQRREMMG